MASLQRDSAHTKYHSGLVVSKSLGAREEKAVFKVRQKVESPLPCSHHHCTSPHTEQGAGVGQGCGSLPVLPITLCLMPHMVPSSSEPHGKGHMGSLGWESVLPQSKGEHVWAAESVAGGQPPRRPSAESPSLARHVHSRLCPPRRPRAPGTEHRGCPGLLPWWRAAAAAAMGHCLSSCLSHLSRVIESNCQQRGDDDSAPTKG